MIVGYARTSTADQKAGLEAQIRDLEAAGCDKIFPEQVSSVTARAELERCLEFVREGDVLIVTKLDRLARSVPNLRQIVDRLEAKQVGLVVQSMGGQQLDTRCPTGKLMLNLLGAIAEFEREMTLERMREGIAKAQRAGRYRGRKPTARAKTDEIVRLAEAGMARAEIAKLLDVGIASVYRILSDNKAQASVSVGLSARGKATHKI